MSVHAQEEKERQDLQPAHKQLPLHVDPGKDVASPSATWSTVDATRHELVLTFLNPGRLGFDLTLSGVSFISDDAPAAVSSTLLVGMALSAVQGKSVLQLSVEEMRQLWATTVDCRPLALAFAMKVPSSDADGEGDAAPENSVSREREPELGLGTAEERVRYLGGHNGHHLRSPTVATQRIVEKSAQSLAQLSKALMMQQEPIQPPGDSQSQGKATCSEMRLDSSAINTVSASAEALRAAADEIELLKRELRMFQQRSGDEV